MKRYLRLIQLIVMLIVILGLWAPAQNCPDNGLVKLGTVDAQWVYKNEMLKISFALPEGWYWYDYLAADKKYLRIGSDYRQMSAELFAADAGPVLDLAQLKKLPFGFEPVILSLAKLEDTQSVIASPQEILDTSISLRVTVADTVDIDQYLKNFYKKIMRNGIDSPEVRPGKIGGLDYQCISVVAPNRKGLTVHNLFCARNFGCINLLIRICYLTESGRSLIFDACQPLKLDN
jgi:hypothetical protein